MPTTVLDGVSIHWQLVGETGEPLVLVHGSWGDHVSWGPLAALLARSFRVLTYDRRGHGSSERPAAQGSVDEDVDDLAALIAHHGLAPAHILGNSFGGVIVLRLAAARPELFRTMLVHEPPAFDVVEDPAARPAVEAAKTRTRAVVDLLASGQMEAGARLFVDSVAFGPGMWDLCPTEMRETFVFNAPTFLDEERDPESRTVDLAALSVFPHPTLLSEGDQSPPFFPVILDSLVRAMPAARRRTLAGVGHVPQVTHPEVYASAVETFIRDAHRSSP
jgi:pimeloyl-ACP methyl ester carboxylesterase